VDFTVGPNLELPHLKKARDAARYLAILALYEASQGRSSKAAEALIAGFGLAKSLESEPCLISQYVRGLIIAQAFEAAEQTINRVSLTSDSLDKLQEALQKLQRHEADGIGFFRGVVGDKLATAAIFGLPADKAERIINDLTTQMEPEEKLSAAPEKYSRRLDQAFTDTLYARILEISEMSYQHRFVQMTDECLKQKKTAKEEGLVLGYLSALRIAHAVSVEVQTCACLRIAGAVIALERYRVITGDYPATLDELRLLSDSQNTRDSEHGTLEYKRILRGYVLITCQPELPNGSGQVSFRVVKGQARSNGSDD
jgi:hypothetical protein